MTTGESPPEGPQSDSEPEAVFADWRPPRSMTEHIDAIGLALSARELGTETVPVDEALGRVLAADVLAPFDLPRFDNSQMDGFAVHSARTPGRFAVEGMIAAGHPHASGTALAGDTASPGDTARTGGGSATDAVFPKDTVSAGGPGDRLAAPIMTGAPPPPGADAVVPVEETEGFDAPAIHVGATAPGRFVRRAGSDIAAGEVAAAAGTVLHPAVLGVLAACGLTGVRVRCRPRVLVVTGGDEVVSPGDDLGPGQIYDANATLLRTVLDRSGARVVGALTVDDTVADFRTALADQVRALAPDLVVTSGGISEGRFEVVRQALVPGPWSGEGVSAQVGFGSVAMQPGGPQGVGLLYVEGRPAGGEPPDARIPVVCFPGNPVSTWTSAHLLLREALATVWGACDTPVRVKAVLAEAVDSLPAKTQIRRALLGQGLRADGPADAESAELRVHAFTGTSSHLLATAARANAMLVVPAGRGTIEAGEQLTAVVL